MKQKPNTKCRVCGKEYYCCASNKKLGGWRAMACCEEHFHEYIMKIRESRNGTPQPKTDDKAITSEATTETEIEDISEDIEDEELIEYTTNIYQCIDFEGGDTLIDR